MAQVKLEISINGEEPFTIMSCDNEKNPEMTIAFDTNIITPENAHALYIVDNKQNTVSFRLVEVTENN
jgi:hypothetical protein